jgi:hypothetical protein
MTSIGLLRMLFGNCVLFGLTVLGAVELGNSLWTITVALGGIFLMFVWMELNMAWWDR